MTYIIIIAIAVLIILYIIAVQRKLIKLDEINQNAISQIGIQQEARWNALTQLANACKSYAGYEKETIADIISQRKPITANSSAQDVNEQERLMDSALSRLMAVVERYPELKASSLYSKAMDAIDKYELKVRSAKMVSNDAITQWNRAVRQFPTSLVASMLNFKSRQYIEVQEDKKEYPDLDFKA